MPKIGAKVLCQFFNVPEARFYGDTWVGTIKKSINASTSKFTNYPRDWLVERKDLPDIEIWNKEILKVLGKGE